MLHNWSLLSPFRIPGFFKKLQSEPEKFILLKRFWFLIAYNFNSHAQNISELLWLFPSIKLNNTILQFYDSFMSGDGIEMRGM